ncbi:hypothetical protein Syun_009369 [Stephania yunnanensis]|uniref:RNA helicase n=1 Tax=Stephania yunnanensis TaxID=152371 RepID=A0AAP0PQT6_9MAGN
MASLPLHPIYSKALILASDFNCMEEMLITVAMLSVESIFYSPRDKLEEEKVLNVYRASSEFVEKRKFNGYKGKIAGKSLLKWCRDNFINSRSLQHAQDIHSQIRGRIENMGLRIASCGEDMIQFQRCLAASFFLNAALKQPDDSYRFFAGVNSLAHTYGGNIEDFAGVNSLAHTYGGNIEDVYVFQSN